jgi:hypothetical protein
MVKEVGEGEVGGSIKEFIISAQSVVFPLILGTLWLLSIALKVKN